MSIEISIKIGGKEGLMNVSLDELKSKPVIVRKKKKKKKSLAKSIESSIPKKSDYTTEVV